MSFLQNVNNFVFFRALTILDFVPNKVYLRGILLHYFIQKKFATDAHRIPIETYNFSVSWGYKIHQLPLCRELRPPTKECPENDTKQSDDEVLVMLELWGMQGTPSLPSFPSLLWPRVLAPDRVLSMSQIELRCLLMLNWIAWNGTVLAFKLCIYSK